MWSLMESVGRKFRMRLSQSERKIEPNGWQHVDSLYRNYGFIAIAITV